MHPLKKAARIAGAIYLSLVLVAPFSMLYVPGKLIVRGNAAATADNILAHETMFRLSIFGDLIGHVIFICLAIALYRLLSSVNKTWALLMVSFVLVSAAVNFSTCSTKRSAARWRCCSSACTIRENSSARFSGACGFFHSDCLSIDPDSCRASWAFG